VHTHGKATVQQFHCDVQSKCTVHWVWNTKIILNPLIFSFVHPDVQEPMFCAGVESGMFDKLFTIFQSQANVRPMTNIDGRMLYGLACTKETAEQKKFDVKHKQ
jgi:hypothetical protein